MDLKPKLAFISMDLLSRYVQNRMFDENVQVSYLRSARECGSNVREGRAAGVRRDMGEVKL